jgi:hypothetical protein
MRDLIGLYLGDRDSCGYYSPRIVFEVCQRTKPSSFSDLRQKFYGGLAVDDIDSDGYEVLERGFETWRDAVRVHDEMTSLTWEQATGQASARRS